MTTARMRWFFLAGAFLPAGSTHQPRNGWTCVQPIGGLGPKSTNAPVASAPNFFWRCRFWPLLQRGGAAEPDAALRRFRRRAADDNAPHSYGPRFGPRRGFPRYMPRDSSPAPKLFNRAAKWLSARDFRHVRGAGLTRGRTELPHGCCVRLRTQLPTRIFWHCNQNADGQ